MLRSGQSLVEVLIGVALGALFIIGVAAVIAPALRTHTKVIQVQTQAGLAKELLDNVRTWTKGNWQNVSNLATTSANRYYLLASSSPFTATSGTESITIGTTTYVRYFYVDDVYRDASGYVTSTVSGNSYDPSTKRATVVYGLSGGAANTAPLYVSRNQANVFDQTDWAGGGGQSGPTAFVGNTFASSTNVDYSSVPGAISATSTAFTGIHLLDSQLASTTSATDLTLSFAAKPATGTLVLVAVSAWQQNINTPTDTPGNTYTLIKSVTETGGGRLALYYAQNVTSTAGTFSVTAKAAGPSNEITAAIFNFLGASTTSTLDQASSTATSTGSGSTILTPNVTTTSTNEMYFAAQINSVGSGWSVGSAWTALQNQYDNVNHESLFTVYKMIAEATTTRATWTTPGATDVDYGSIIATFK